MKPGSLSLVELAAKIEANKELKRDYIVETPSIAMEIDEDRTPMLSLPAYAATVGGKVTAFPASRVGVLGTAHDQLGDRLKIPAKYYDRMLKEDPELLAINVNTWFQRNPEKRMVRTLGGDARAFLSNRYNRVENEEIAGVALPILLNLPEMEVFSCEVTDRRLYIQVITPRVRGEVAVGDIVQAGVQISNSEIGHGSVSVSAFFKRLRCKNGMTSLDKFRAYHVGRQIEDTDQLWKDDTREADDRLVLLKVRDMIEAAISEDVFNTRLEQMRGLTVPKITGDPAKAVELLAAKVGANEDEKGGILRALIEGGDLSAWGVLNAVTAQAHEAKTYDRGVDFEAAGGMLLELPKGEWSRILEAV